MWTLLQGASVDTETALSELTEATKRMDLETSQQAHDRVVSEVSRSQYTELRMTLRIRPVLVLGDY